jgi:hypothetical protein
LFDECEIGLTNTEGAGNFHVYQSVFRRSAVSDMSIGNTGGFSARDNYSIGSKAFFVGGGTNNPATINIQRNTILDPRDAAAIRFGNQGPGLILDNVVRSRQEAVGPVISWASFLNADVTSVGNLFTVPNPVESNGRLISIDDRVIARAAINGLEPALPGTPRNLQRRVFEIQPGSDGGAIQAAVIAAARESGRRPIVHIAHGTYSIADTITIPASDLQLIGDGYGTTLRWTGSGAGPVMRIVGPSKATLREIQIDGQGRGDGIVVENADQPGARVYMEQAQLRAGKRTDLLVDALDHVDIQLENIGFAYSPEAVSIKVLGGPMLAAGGETGGRTNIFSGASSGNRISIEVSSGGRLLVRDLWYEGGAGSGFARIHGRAIFSIEGARISSPVNQDPAAFAVESLDGRAAILTTDIDDRIMVSGEGSRASVMALGVLGEQRSSKYFADTSVPSARARLINSRQLSLLPGVRSAPTANVGAPDSALIAKMLSHTREQKPFPLKALPADVTDFRLFRVWIANGTNNIRIAARR